MKKTCILLPTFNEECSVLAMIRLCRKAGKYDICVVDSCSSDDTTQLARKAGAIVLDIPRRGKGLAISIAMDMLDYDRLVMIDSDMSYCPEDIPRLLEKLRKYDVVVGSRLAGHIDYGAMSMTHKAGNTILTMLANLLYDIHTTDLCSGFWAFTRNAYKGMAIDARHFSLEANFYCQCARNGLDLGIVPIRYKKRVGTSKLNILHGLEIASYLIGDRILWAASI